MIEKETGGPAFPVVVKCLDGSTEIQAGMTLRDWFAGKALEGMLGGEPGSHLVPPNAAELAFEYADAMIAERAK